MIILDIIILGLATWRISSLFTTEAGPGKMFEKIRILVGIKHDGDGNVLFIPPKFFPELLSCMWCTSIWVGIILTILYIYVKDVGVIIALPFALSAIAILLDRLLNNPR